MFQVTWQESNKPIGLATMKLEPIGCHWPHTFCAKRTKYPIWGVYHFWITGGRLVIFQFTSDKLGRWICRMKIHNNLARLPTFIDRVYYSLFCDMKINSVNFAEFTTIYLGSTTFVTLGVLQICGSPNLWSHWFSGPMQNSCRRCEQRLRSKKQHLDMAKWCQNVWNCQLTSHVCILHPIFAIQVRSRPNQNIRFRFNRLDPVCQGPGLRSPRKWPGVTTSEAQIPEIREKNRFCSPISHVCGEGGDDDLDS
jgi:hypothetical protein